MHHRTALQLLLKDHFCTVNIDRVGLYSFEAILAEEVGLRPFILF